MPKRYLLYAALLGSLVFAYAGLAFCSPLLSRALTIEDGLVESLSAVFYVAAGGLMLLLYSQDRTLQPGQAPGGRRNGFYLLLSLLFFACCGEELSWGQRIFHVATPPYLQKVNVQHEMNLHNLAIFNGKENKQSSTGWVVHLLFSANGLYSLVWCCYGFGLPLLSRTNSWVARRAKQVRLPVFSLGLGLLFGLNFLFFKFFSALRFQGRDVTPLVELKETLVALLYLAGSLQLVAAYRRQVAVPEEGRSEGGG